MAATNAEDQKISYRPKVSRKNASPLVVIVAVVARLLIMIEIVLGVEALAQVALHHLVFASEERLVES